ncbi:PTS sugar transporter subunit IIB [Vibrio toranzoniae]|uniref:PTS sugar transporter subunit IIB n=1 Tax=Vibrio toranzoniae TaxID=1194427 RepID=UPI0013769901|nr:PTS sugar transporter subunit IIB [Vibrio toranzoniae]NAZ94373.1 PTS galactitol transporter subunit IIB [Vibrio toranzoniae]
MKTMMICCGAGVATSTVALKKIEGFLKSEGLDKKVNILQGSVAEVVTRSDVDFIVSTSTIKDSRVKVISGLPLLTGFGVEKVYSAIKEQLEA